MLLILTVLAAGPSIVILISSQARKTIGVPNSMLVHTFTRVIEAEEASIVGKGSVIEEVPEIAVEAIPVADEVGKGSVIDDVPVTAVCALPVADKVGSGRVMLEVPTCLASPEADMVRRGSVILDIPPAVDPDTESVGSGRMIRPRPRISLWALPVTSRVGKGRVIAEVPVIAVEARPVEDRIGNGKFIDDEPICADTPVKSMVGRGSVIAEVPVTDPPAAGMIYAMVSSGVIRENGLLL